MVDRIRTFHVAGNLDWGIPEALENYYEWAKAPADKADVIVFAGGADIQPSIYGERALHTTSCSPQRDRVEVAEYEAAVKAGKPTLGICRGAQLIHALNGGKLWQHVNNHNRGPHKTLDLATGNIFTTTSCHHQMMQVNDEDIDDNSKPYRVVGIACESTERHEHGLTLSIPEPGKFRNDIEVLWYPEVGALCYQGHPEYGVRTCINYYTILLHRFHLITTADLQKTLSKIWPRQDASALAARQTA